jgi:CO/xanthine dehydrogenase FAD-binding subunit
MNRLALPQSLADVWTELKKRPHAMIYNGGTDVLTAQRGQSEFPGLICLERVAELLGVTQKGDGIGLGAGCTHSRLLAEPLVRDKLPVLARALSVLGSPPIRNMGTIGGNICTASPAGDTLPPLYALGARLELVSEKGIRHVPLTEYITGPGATTLEPGEILKTVWVKEPKGYNLQYYEKVGQRNAMAISLVSLAAMLNLDSQGIIRAARLTWGSVGPTIQTAPAAEEALVGHRLDRKMLDEAAFLVSSAIKPITDPRASAEYRRMVASRLLLRLLEPNVIKALG